MGDASTNGTGRDAQLRAIPTPEFRALLRALLEREQYETEGGHDELQLAYRHGWNDRSQSLLAELAAAEAAR